MAGEVIIYEVRGGRAEDAGDFEGAGDLAGEAKGGVAGGVFLVVGGFVGFVNQDKAEVVNEKKKGGAGADDDGGGGGFEEVKPEAAAGGRGLLGVEQGDAVAEGLLENLDDLAGEGDFGDEEDDGFLRFEGF